MHRPLLSLLALSVVLSACADSKEPTSQNSSPSAQTEQTSPIGSVAQPTTVAPAPEPATSSQTNSVYETLSWESLELPGQGLADIMRKYQPMLDKITDNDVEEGDKLMAQMQNEFNTAPTNPALNGKSIQIKGFVSPLEVDEKKGLVKEFLLVPYFGACIHVPPPPVNQTLLVRPQEGKSISMEQIYEPVIVSGVITVETAGTKLAQAGYQISKAVVEPLKDTEY
ncbi:MAG: DUF3299 domain-containing protein [Thiothrix sp.]|nr:MAG: DUF3299 domain-containing protein [Thiothrix sp.]